MNSAGKDSAAGAPQLYGPALLPAPRSCRACRGPAASVTVGALPSRQRCSCRRGSCRRGSCRRFPCRRFFSFFKMTDISVLSHENRKFPPSDAFRRAAVVSDPRVYQTAAADIEAYWAREARELEWITPFKTVL